MVANLFLFATPPPGSIFPIGDTKVRCIAADKTDNKTIIATFTVKVTPEPCINYNMDTNTIDIMCKATLSKINRLVNNPNVLEKDPHGVWILYAILRVSPQGELIINRTDTSWLKIANQKFHENEPNFILISGNAQIDGVKITSWNPHSNDVIRQNVKGSVERPYILINNSSGSTNISNSEIAFLGSASSPGEYGISYHSGKGGSIIANNTFHDMPAGFYSDSVGHITIRNNNFNDNSNFGIAIYQSQNDKIYNNLLKSSHVSIHIGDDSMNNHVYSNTITNSTFGVSFAGSKSKNNLVENNQLSGVPYPVTFNGINNVGKNNSVYNR